MKTATDPLYQEDTTASGLTIITKEEKPWWHPHASELDWYFPKVDPGGRPLGNKILVQLRRTKMTSHSGIVLVEETKETEKWNTQVARIISLGPIAYCNRSTGEPWPEGTWVKPGDFARVPRWGGDRWDIQVGDEKEPSLFAVFNDHEVYLEITGDPLKVKAFIL